MPGEESILAEAGDGLVDWSPIITAITKPQNSSVLSSLAGVISELFLLQPALLVVWVILGQ